MYVYNYIVVKGKYILSAIKASLINLTAFCNMNTYSMLYTGYVKFVDVYTLIVAKGNSGYNILEDDPIRKAKLIIELYFSKTKTFDTVWHCCRLYKAHLANVIRNCFNNTKQFL